MRSKFAVAVVAALLVGLLGLPASADINDAGVLVGSAEVGKTFWSFNDCDKTGQANPVGRGLFLVGSEPDRGRAAQGSWHLDAVVISLQHLEGARLEACGWLDAVAGTEDFQWPGQTNPRTKGIGAACGASRGHSGMGEYGPLGAPFAKLMHLGWNSVGDVFLVTGQYQEYVAGGPAKGKKGTVLAQLLGAGGGGDCVLDPEHGAQSFTVVGTIGFINAVVVPKPPTEQCKHTDNDKDKVKETAPGKRPCPTAKK